MATEAQRRASTRYNKANTTQVLLRLNLNTERDIIEALDTQESKAGYIKRLIREDVARNTQVAEAEDELEDEPKACVYQRYELEAFLGEPDDFDVDAIEAEVRDRWCLFSDEELADICMAHLKAEADC